MDTVHTRDMNTTSTATRTHYRLESRPADRSWERRAVSVNLDGLLALLRTSADESPRLNWRVVSGSPFGDDRDPLHVHAVRGAL
jgi:hypothetical protein